MFTKIKSALLNYCWDKGHTLDKNIPYPDGNTRNLTAREVKRIAFWMKLFRFVQSI